MPPMDDDLAKAQSLAILKEIVAEFPEARLELANMLRCLADGQQLLLSNVHDLKSRLKIMKVFQLLRVQAVDRGQGKDKAFQRTKNTVRRLRRSFGPFLGVSDSESDSESDSDSSSSSSSKKKKKKDKKKKEKKKKEKKKKKKKDKKKKERKAEKEVPTSAPDAVAEGPRPPPQAPKPERLRAPTAELPPELMEEDKDSEEAPASTRRVLGPAMPPPGGPAEGGDDGEDSDSSSFGPGVSYQQLKGDAAYARGAEDVVLPRVAEEGASAKTGGREEWMTMVPEGGGPLGSMEWRKGKARGVSGRDAEKARKSWSALPAEKAAMQSEEAKREREEEEAQRAEIEAMDRKRADAANERMKQAYERANEGRTKSLMQMHEEKMAKEKSAMHPMQWDKERDFDSFGRVDSARLTSSISNAREQLGRKFGHGKSHYLGGGM